MRLNKGIVTALAVFLATGCDPFNSEVGGTPTVISVVASDAGTPFEAVAAGSTWTVTMPSACDDATGQVAGDVPIIFVKFNKLLDGFKVQTSPATCEPAGGWLEAAPPAPTGEAWYSCYNPSSPTAAEGASVVIYRAPATPASNGWAQASSATLPASGTAITTNAITAAGNVADKGGATAAIDVSVRYEPNPGTAGDPVAGTVTATTIALSWAAPGCNAEAEYVLERAPDVAGAAGTYAQVGTANVTGTTFTDTGRSTATTYWYRLTAVTRIGTTNYPGPTSGEVSVTTL